MKKRSYTQTGQGLYLRPISDILNAEKAIKDQVRESEDQQYDRRMSARKVRLAEIRKEWAALGQPKGE